MVDKVRNGRGRYDRAGVGKRKRRGRVYKVRNRKGWYDAAEVGKRRKRKGRDG